MRPGPTTGPAAEASPGPADGAVDGPVRSTVTGTADATVAGFEEFARVAQQRLYRTAYLLCGNPETARDLTQTTLAKLYQHWRRAGAADHPHAYAKTVLTRTFLSERRRGLRDLLAFTRTGGMAPAPAADHTDLRVTLLAALAELPPRARAMVVLRYWDDQSVTAVASLLRCSEATVKSQCSRSLARLRVRLGDAGLYTTGS
ncbi:SigE family RNA polymerase sigma factor [Streptomyces sp. NBC_00572]|uniref:SigE family RNA polymerase sigma factor n=1 Tax=Streptomyces sp. NBC_00572 TaxID=2903664 RepID=UPI002256AEFA|nr:SigE family RNA polymerase sigma factor [Streptomyces sp. NBC_00572]MCX4982705.1 SigE family RNA polymerase sigma factor [Streptomyces sp. NBC_00572]